MAQTLFAICLFAGVLALASAQNWDYQSCSSKVRAEIDRYRASMMQTGQKFTNSMQNTAGQATDISGIQQSIDKMTQSVSSLSDMSNGIDVGRITSVYMQNMQTAVDIGRQFVRPSLISGGLGSYLDMINSILRDNTQFLQTATAACLPANRST